jgi:hypothetical protein
VAVVPSDHQDLSNYTLVSRFCCNSCCSRLYLEVTADDECGGKQEGEGGVESGVPESSRAEGKVGGARFQAVDVGVRGHHEQRREAQEEGDGPTDAQAD